MATTDQTPRTDGAWLYGEQATERAPLREDGAFYGGGDA